MPDQREELTKLLNVLKRNNGPATFRAALYLVGAVPFPGLGLAAAAGSILAEREQEAVNRTVVQFLEDASVDIARLNAVITEMLAGDAKTPATLTMLLTEVFGEEGAMRLTSQPGLEFAVMLNPQTAEEFWAFERAGLLRIRSTGAMMTLGAHNRIGNFVEERKRPYGMGTGYVGCVVAPTGSS